MSDLGEGLEVLHEKLICIKQASIGQSCFKLSEHVCQTQHGRLSLSEKAVWQNVNIFWGNPLYCSWRACSVSLPIKVDSRKYMR